MKYVTNAQRSNISFASRGKSKPYIYVDNSETLHWRKVWGLFVFLDAEMHKRFSLGVTWKWVGSQKSIILSFRNILRLL